MTRQEQLDTANEIYVLCRIVAGYINSFAPMTDAAKQLQERVEDVSAAFLDLTDELVDDGSPKDLGLCPSCGEEITSAPDAKVGS